MSNEIPPSTSCFKDWQWLLVEPRHLLISHCTLRIYTNVPSLLKICEFMSILLFQMHFRKQKTCIYVTLIKAIFGYNKLYLVVWFSFGGSLRLHIRAKPETHKSTPPFYNLLSWKAKVGRAAAKTIEMYRKEQASVTIYISGEAARVGRLKQFQLNAHFGIS